MRCEGKGTDGKRCAIRTRGPNFKLCWRHANCKTCLDAGFIRTKRTGHGGNVLPCPDCNPDGKDIEGEAS